MSSKLCLICDESEKKGKKISTMKNKPPTWKLRRNEYTIYPNDRLPSLPAPVRSPPGANLQVPLNLGKKYANRFVFYWASTPSKPRQLKVAKASQAYSNYSNQGLAKTDTKGKATLLLHCPQNYKSGGNTFLPHIHFVVSKHSQLLDTPKPWELQAYTMGTICKLNRNQMAKHSRLRNALLLNALPYQYYLEDHIPNSYSLPYQNAAKMSQTKIHRFIQQTLKNYPTLYRAYQRKTFNLMETPIVTYCYDHKCDASKQLVETLRNAGFRNIKEYQPGIIGWNKKKTYRKK